MRKMLLSFVILISVSLDLKMLTSNIEFNVILHYLVYTLFKPSGIY